jgi:hypothetical protein
MSVDQWLSRFLPRRDIRRGETLLFRRWYLTPRRWPCVVLIHHFLSPDVDPDPHDHPWPFLTFILKGGYHEHVYTAAAPARLVRELVARPGTARYRSAKHVHKVARLLTGSCWTLVVTFGRRRTWGFRTPAGFVDWRTYTGAAPDYDPLEDLAPLPEAAAERKGT